MYNKTTYTFPAMHQATLKDYLILAALIALVIAAAYFDAPPRYPDQTKPVESTSHVIP
jgi:hypothetical protein